MEDSAVKISQNRNSDTPVHMTDTDIGTHLCFDPERVLLHLTKK